MNARVSVAVMKERKLKRIASGESCERGLNGENKCVIEMRGESAVGRVRGSWLKRAREGIRLPAKTLLRPPILNKIVEGSYYKSQSVSQNNRFV